MQKISCSGSQLPTVRVSVVALTPSGPVEAFDFAEYQSELFEKFQNMRAQHPYVLTGYTEALPEQVPAGLVGQREGQGSHRFCFLCHSWVLLGKGHTLTPEAPSPNCSSVGVLHVWWGWWCLCIRVLCHQLSGNEISLFY